MLLAQAEPDAPADGAEKAQTRLHTLSLGIGFLLAFVCVVLFHLALLRHHTRLGHSGAPFLQSANATADTSTSQYTWLGYPLDDGKLAFITETRITPQLIPLLLHFISVVPPEWPFLFVGSQHNIAALRASKAVRDIEYTGKLEFQHLDYVKYPMMSQESVSKALTTLGFWDQYVSKAEHVLVWQTDSIICSNSNQSINDWLEYDYVGAPWAGWEYGGNGGLSLRRMSRLRRALKEYPRADGGALEDWWISQSMLKFSDHNVAPRDLEGNFSVESVWNEAPLGYHVGREGLEILYGNIWRERDRWMHIKEYCPEVQMILRTLDIP